MAAILPVGGDIYSAPFTDTDRLILSGHPACTIHRTDQLVGHHMGESLQVFPPESVLGPDFPPVPLSSAARCSALPHVGKYNPDSYEMNRQLMIIQLPLDQLMTMPDAVRTHVSEVAETDVYVMVHERPEKPHEDLNMLYHGWVYPDKPEGHNEVRSVTMGIFCYEGLLPGVASSPMPLEAMAGVSVHVHDYRCSPDNARFRVDSTEDICAFWAIAKDGARQVISYHVITMNEVLDGDVKTMVADEGLHTLEGFVEVSGGFSRDRSLMERFIRTVTVPFIPSKF